MPSDLISEMPEKPDTEDATLAPAPTPVLPDPKPHRFHQKRQQAAAQARKRRIGEWVIEHGLMVVGLIAVIAVIAVLFFMLRDALPLFFTDRNPTTGERIGLGSFLFGDEWRPISSPERFEILALTVGSLLITVGASIIAIPLGFACAVYLAELAPRAVREVMKPTVELLAAIPSVVMGFIGLIVLNPFLRETFSLNTGMTALAGAIMLAFMSLPTIISIAEDAITAVPRSYREGSMALGASALSTIRHAVLPAASSGLVAAAMLGIGRALGETMTVLMVAGNSIAVPLGFLGDNSLAFVQKLSLLVSTGFGFLQPARTMTATLASEMGETAMGSPHYHALFAVGALLCLISFAITLISDFALRRVKQK